MEAAILAELLSVAIPHDENVIPLPLTSAKIKDQRKRRT